MRSILARKHLTAGTIFFLSVTFGLLLSGTNNGSASVAASQNTQQAPVAQARENPTHKYFTDVELINQDGQKMRLYSDLLKDKVVVINSFFSTCPGACLPLIRNMHKLQTALGDRVGHQVHLISITVDPTVDTPARLKEFAMKMGSQNGWYFLTGDKANVELALHKLGQAVEKKEEHVNIFIIGNERTGLWKKAFGLAPSEELVKAVESVLNDKMPG